MVYSNADIVRQLLGDLGEPQRDTANGDGTQAVFYVSTPPVRAASQAVYVSGTLFTEVAAAPIAAQYTLDDGTGRITFGVAPVVGTANVEATYLSVEITEAEVTEALRQFGLVDTDAAAVGLDENAVLAALFLAEGQIARYASQVNYSADGESIQVGAISARWEAVAAALRTKILSPLSSLSSGLTSIKVRRVDGYSDDANTRDVQVVGVNARRRFYGMPDRIP